MRTEDKSDMIRLGGLWENESAAGTVYLSGTLGGAKLLVFRNSFKEQDGGNAPDWILYVAPRAERRDDEATVRMDAVDDGRPDEIPF